MLTASSPPPLRAKQGALQLGPGSAPYAEAVEAAARAARAAGAPLVLLWYPHQWGGGARYDPLLHTSVLQEIYPVLAWA